jgi:hypothetical protein
MSSCGKCAIARYQTQFGSVCPRSSASSVQAELAGQALSNKEAVNELIFFDFGSCKINNLQ